MSSSNDAGKAIGNGIKDAWNTFAGAGDVIRGNFNQAVDGAGDAIAGREHGSVGSRGSSETSISSSNDTHQTNADIAAKGEAAIKRGIDRL